jgi:hypothetical protein
LPTKIISMFGTETNPLQINQIATIKGEGLKLYIDDFIIIKIY